MAELIRGPIFNLHVLPQLVGVWLGLSREKTVSIISGPSWCNGLTARFSFLFFVSAVLIMSDLI